MDSYIINGQNLISSRAKVHKPCTCARDGTARHVAGEGRAASAIGGEGERTLGERDR
jgi:hypothetical protein